jgi:hypothetical protein
VDDFGTMLMAGIVLVAFAFAIQLILLKAVAQTGLTLMADAIRELARAQNRVAISYEKQQERLEAQYPQAPGSYSGHKGQ